MAERDNGGKFLPGHKGYKKAGTRHYDGLRKILKSKEPEILDAVVQQAIDGTNPTAMLFMLKKMYGADPITNFKLHGDNILDVSKNLLSAVGSVDAQVLNNASKVIDNHLRVVEATEILDRLQKLEEQADNESINT